MDRISGSDLEVFPLCLGGNVFGWTADEAESFDVLDAYADRGGNFVDTADMYTGGRSEQIIGKWMKARGNRSRMVVATNVGKMAGLEGLGSSTIEKGVDESLRRLQTDYIDLYYSHADDLRTPIEETLQAFDELVRAGKVRYLGASNYAAERLDESVRTAKSRGLAPYVALQPHYNLMERNEYEASLSPAVERNALSCVPYFSLAMGFLTGKYRPETEVPDSPRSTGASAYLDERGVRVLKVLDSIAAEAEAPVAAVALAWLASRPNVVAPIASARNTSQLEALLPVADLRLDRTQLDALTDASGY